MSTEEASTTEPDEDVRRSLGEALAGPAWPPGAASIPDEWVKAAEGHYSMHGSGLIRNILAGVAPLIAATERERLARLAEELDACYTPRAGTDSGVTFSFADFIRGRR